jgi:hypothetical protein
VYIRNVKKHKVEIIKKEFARLGRICDVVRVTGYGLTSVKCVVRNCYKAIPDPSESVTNNTCDIDSYPAREPASMENFGRLQYIIDKMPPNEKLVVIEFFVHKTPKSQIAKMIGRSPKVVDRILRNLKRFEGMI